MKRKPILGIHADSDDNPNYELMKEAGIKWLRVGFSYPYRNCLHGELTEKFQDTVEHVKNLRRKGFRIMGVTPLAGYQSFNKSLFGAQKHSVWHPQVPEWAGPYDSDKFYESYEEGCKKIGQETAGIVELWQVSNEMDISIFRGAMTVEQAARFLKAGSLGLKKGNPEAKTSINPAVLGNDGIWLFRALYSGSERIFDYAGIDGYFGSWAPGGPESWPPVIEEVHRLTDSPVLVHEWGYSSLGQVRKHPTGPTPKGWNSWNCYEKAWYNVWRKAHSREEQAEYIKTTLELFADIPNLVGNFFFRWSDTITCWQCGEPNCPSECGWGLVDTEGKPKPAYYAFKETYKSLYA